MSFGSLPFGVGPFGSEPAEPVVLGDFTAPQVFDFDPPEETELASDQAVSFSVTDDSGDFHRIIVAVLYDETGLWEVAYDGDGFAPFYVTRSLRTDIASGFRFTLVRFDGWPAAPSIRVFAIDPSCNEANE